ncbi:ATP-dependent DNA ligase [Streptomyces coeruleorubidus]
MAAPMKTISRSVPSPARHPWTGMQISADGTLGTSSGTSPSGRTSSTRYALTRPVHFVAFDLLRLSETDTTLWPYRRRRAALESLFAARRLSPPWVLCPSTADPDTVRDWLTCAAVGMEGVVYKRLDSRYEPSVRGWRKYNSLASPRSLLLGRYDGRGRLRYTGRTTTLTRRPAGHSPVFSGSARAPVDGLVVCCPMGHQGDADRHTRASRARGRGRGRGRGRRRARDAASRWRHPHACTAPAPASPPPTSPSWHRCRRDGGAAAAPAGGQHRRAPRSRPRLRRPSRPSLTPQLQPEHGRQPPRGCQWRATSPGRRRAARAGAGAPRAPPASDGPAPGPGGGGRPGRAPERRARHPHPTGPRRAKEEAASRVPCLTAPGVTP